jgi:hypothetical protein
VIVVEHIIGTTTNIDASHFASDRKTVYDMTGRVWTMRLRVEGDAGEAVDIERDSDTAAEFTWDTRDEGTGTWHFKSDWAPAAGTYDAEVYASDASTPTVRKRIFGPFKFKVIGPVTGAF